MKRTVARVGAAGALAALCGLAQGQSLPRQGGEQWSAPRIPPNADTDSNERRIAPVTACFAEGTDPAYVRAVSAIVDARNAALGFGGVDYYTSFRWTGEFGTPVNIRWSFAPDGLSIDGSIGEPTAPNVLFAKMDFGFASAGGRATWIGFYEGAFARWAELCGNVYTRIKNGPNDWDDGAAWGTAGSNGLRGDVRIAGHTIDGVGGVLAYNFFPNDGDMTIDTDDIGPFFSDPRNQFVYFRDVIMHEHGHGLGLKHSCSTTDRILMFPFANNSFDGPRQDDIRSVQSLYGDINGAIDTTEFAKDLGLLAPGSSIPSSGFLGTTPPPLAFSADPNSAILSLDPFKTSDYYKITAPTGIALTINAQPKGSTYQNAPQTSGVCGTTGTTDALAIADLVVRVYASDGVTLLATANAGVAGQGETITDLILPNAGVYYIRISSNTTLQAVQSYLLQMSATSAVICPSFTTNPVQESQYCLASGLSFTAAATGRPTPTLQWRKDGVAIPGATGGTLSIPSPTLDDAGVYDCVATNSCSSVPSASVSVAFSDIRVTTQPQSASVPVGAVATFTVAGSGAVNGYQWKKDGNPIGGATLPILSFATQSGDGGLYTCALAGPCGTVTSNAATLTLTPACYANCDGSTLSPVLNISDYVCFLGRFRSGDLRANCDGSTTAPVLGAADFVCFLQTFRAGCP